MVKIVWFFCDFLWFFCDLFAIFLWFFMIFCDLFAIFLWFFCDFVWFFVIFCVFFFLRTFDWGKWGKEGGRPFNFRRSENAMDHWTRLHLHSRTAAPERGVSGREEIKAAESMFSRSNTKGGGEPAGSFPRSRTSKNPALRILRTANPPFVIVSSLLRRHPLARSLFPLPAGNRPRPKYSSGSFPPVFFAAVR